MNEDKVDVLFSSTDFGASFLVFWEREIFFSRYDSIKKVKIIL